MPLAVVAEEGAARRIVGLVALPAVGDSITGDRGPAAISGRATIGGRRRAVIDRRAGRVGGRGPIGVPVGDLRVARVGRGPPPDPAGAGAPARAPAAPVQALDGGGDRVLARQRAGDGHGRCGGAQGGHAGGENARDREAAGAAAHLAASGGRVALRGKYGTVPRGSKEGTAA